jgi:hypothetical protein
MNHLVKSQTGPRDIRACVERIGQCEGNKAWEELEREAVTPQGGTHMLEWLAKLFGRREPEPEPPLLICPHCKPPKKLPSPEWLASAKDTRGNDILTCEYCKKIGLRDLWKIMGLGYEIDKATGQLVKKVWKM